MNLDDVIVAVSSAVGGLRGIVRVSGKGSWRVCGEAIGSKVRLGWAGGVAVPEVLDVGICGVMAFAGPRSYTGEDLVELHVPGNGVILRAVVERVVEAGRRTRVKVRCAEAGEFSARAFFHGKMDLTEAEGVGATIHAKSRRELDAAASLRSGELHRWTAQTTERVASVLALVEAGIDFVEEEGVAFISAEQVRERLCGIIGEIDRLERHAVRWERVSGIATIVLTGKPNVGKSSLLNALCGSERAIVSHIAGTTRDAISAVIDLGGVQARLVDVAGEENALDEMRGKMNAARIEALTEADLVIHMIAVGEQATEPPAGALIVENKADLGGTAREGIVRVSAKTGEGLATLRQEITRRLTALDAAGTHHLTLNARHRSLLDAARTALASAMENATEEAACRHPELLAAELRRALDLLGAITGAISPDEVLGRIFSTFCIGK